MALVVYRRERAANCALCLHCIAPFLLIGAGRWWSRDGGVIQRCAPPNGLGRWVGHRYVEDIAPLQPLWSARYAHVIGAGWREWFSVTGVIAGATPKMLTPCAQTASRMTALALACGAQETLADAVLPPVDASIIAGLEALGETQEVTRAINELFKRAKALGLPVPP